MIYLGLSLQLSFIVAMYFSKQVFHLLIAPPAWGKTRLLTSWLALGEQEFMFISPLRALAVEVQQTWPKLWVVLPEDIVNLDWEALARAKPNLVVIWDEVHLVYEWGNSFRHQLLEAWWGFCLSGLSGVGLTATLREEAQEFIQSTLSENHTHLITGDAGNFVFKHTPHTWLVGHRESFLELLNYSTGRTLIFCDTRFEVDQLAKVLADQAPWTCKGGETKAFAERLTREVAPQLIIATSCLSHGVNLPTLDRVIVLSVDAPHWLAHQMWTRGGRRGESYEVWSSWGVSRLGFAHRIVAFLRLILRVKIERWKVRLGARRYCRSDYSAERTRFDRAHAVA